MWVFCLHFHDEHLTREQFFSLWLQGEEGAFAMRVPTVVVTEHRVLSVTCPGCGKCCRAAFPAGVT